MLKNLKGDLFGGITAGVVALPLALAFGIQAFGGISDPGAGSLGAFAGLIGAIFLGFFAAIFGGTHSQISGPTGPMTVVTAGIISAAWASSSGNLATVIVALSLAGICCGLFQILFGIIRIGKYVRYIPYPVLSGFMSGIGVIIILQQIYPLIGQKSPVLVVDMLTQFPQRISQGVSLAALGLGIGTIAIVALLPKLSKRVPSTLAALIIMSLISLAMNLDMSLCIGQIPSGFPMPVFLQEGLGDVDWTLAIQSAIIPGLTLAGLGSIDTLLTSVVADNITKTRHNSNKELVGQGIGNAMAGLFCGLSGAGATMRTVVNVKSGGSTQLSGVVHALFLLAVLYGLGPVVAYVPLSVLAGILITVGWGIIDFNGFRDLRRIPRSDAFVLLVVFFTTVFVDLLTAVGIGMLIACVLFMKRIGDLVEGKYSTQEMTTFDKESPWHDEGGIPEAIQHRIYIQRLDGPLFFGSITRFKDVMNDVPDGVKYVIIRMRRVDFMDQSGLYAMRSAIADLQARGITVLMTIIQPQPLLMLTKSKVIPDVVPEDHTFPTFEACTEFLRAHS
ncbi:MAG: SulP family inorganic anion transporter [Prevotella sp.]|nr:SulP family inorganic anion transporter [Prevotella sp.]MCM1475067.1 SulP family inorganic anion transporter [Muribaculaceae bacterium]